MARCAVRAVFSGATLGVRRAQGVIRAPSVLSFRPLDAGGDIAGNVPIVLSASDRA